MPAPLKDPHKQFYQHLSTVWNMGREIRPHGRACREVMNFSYTVPPRQRFLCFKHAKVNLDLVKQEFIWCFDQQGQWKSLLRNAEKVVSELTLVPDGRVAVLTPDQEQAVAYLNFHIRGNKLYMYVRMKMQEAIKGLGTDLPVYSLLQEMMYARLKQEIPSLVLGSLYIAADSFYVAECHYQVVDKILRDPTISVDFHDDCPPLTTEALEQLSVFMDVFKRERRAPHVAEEHEAEPFLRWLLKRDDTMTLTTERFDDYPRAL